MSEYWVIYDTAKGLLPISYSSKKDFMTTEGVNSSDWNSIRDRVFMAGLTSDQVDVIMGGEYNSKREVKEDSSLVRDRVAV
jgi:hypothetical protein